MRNPLKVTAEGERRWRYWWHFVNDNDRPDGTYGSIWRYGRLYVHSRARRPSDLFNVQWYLWRKKQHPKDLNLEVSFGTGFGDTSGFHSHIGLPKLGDVYLTVAMPQRLLHSWIPRHGERSFGLRIGYCGYWLWLLLGFDGQNDSTGMSRSALTYPDCANCGWPQSAHPREDGRGGWHKDSCPGLCDTYVPKPITWKDRLREHPGFEVKIRIRLRDYLWGRTKYTVQTVKEKQVEIPLDGRTYPATWKLTTATWKRPRAFWVSHRRTSSELDVPHPPAFSGKGENSWDCGDDGIFGLTSNATTEAGAIGDYIKAVLRNRERYGEAGDPDAFQPTAVTR
jgi:hypothetical protein